MIEQRDWVRASRVAAVALVAAGGLLCWSIAGALGLEPLPPLNAGAVVEASTVADRRDEVAGDDVVRRAVERNPFNPTRQPPAVRFSLAATELPEADDRSRDRGQDGPRPTLIGIAQTGASGFVLASFPGEDSRVVRIGDSIGGWRLVRVTDGVASFRSSDGKDIDLRMPASDR